MKKLYLVLGMLCLSATVFAQTNQLPKLKLENFSSGYIAPLGIENAGDDRLFIVGKYGQVWIANASGTKNPTPFIDISDRVNATGSEQGLLGLAFHPNYDINGYFFLSYINLAGNSRVSRFQVTTNPDIADKSSEVVFVRQFQPFINHNGGQIKFGPDGYLYIGFGDGGDAGDPFNYSQKMNTKLGKILRIDVNFAANGNQYGIPPTNPFIGMSGYKPEIWASGLRNPWRFSFDSMNGDLWISDVGQVKWEEVNHQPGSSSGGENYGWSCWEGAHFFKSDCDANSTPPTFPIAEYKHTTNAMCSGSITGGYVYRGMLFPKMMGKYFYTDYCSGEIRTVYQDHDVWVNRHVKMATPLKYSSFGQDMNGEMYLANVVDGIIYHLIDSTVMVPAVSGNSKRSFTQNQSRDEISLYPNPNAGEFTVEFNALIKEAYTVNITTQLGQVILSENRTSAEGLNVWKFSSDQFSKGIYTIEFRTSEGAINKKFSVQ